MITLDQVKIIREKKKDNPNQINLFGNNSGKKKKYTPPSKEKSDAIQARSANRDAKKYASGEYPKIGGGERITPKSKGPGASTGGTKIPPATVGGKNKGTTPVKVNITKPVKQSEVSKKAKQFTTKINKANINRKEFPGDKSGAYKRVKTDIETKNLIKKAGGSGDIGFTAPDRKTKVAKRTTRAVKQGTPDPFSTPTPKKPIRPFGDKPVTSSAPGFGKGMTGGQIKTKAMDKKSFQVTQPTSDLLPKSFKDFSKKIKKYRVDTDIDKKIKNPKLDISKVIKKRKSETPVQQSIPGTGGNRNIKKTYNKKTSRQKPPSGGGSSKYTQGSLFDKPSASGSSGGGGGKPPGGKPPGGGALVPPGGSSGGSGGSGGINPEIVQGKFKETGKSKVTFGRGPDYVPPKTPKTSTFKKVMKSVGKFARKNPGKAGLIGLGIVGGGMALKSYLNRRGDLKSSDIRQTTKISDPSGKAIRFKYTKKDSKGLPTYPHQASSYLTKDKKTKDGVTIPGSLTKFRTGQYSVKDKTTGKKINIDQKIKTSAFTKQYQDAQKGTGFLGRQTQKDKDFVKKYKKATGKVALK